MNNPSIPETDSIQELARFWDAHDLTDFEDELEEVTEPVFEREAVLTIAMQPREAEALKQLAKSEGVSSAHLIRKWVLERMHAS